MIFDICRYSNVPLDCALHFLSSEKKKKIFSLLVSLMADFISYCPLLVRSVRAPLTLCRIDVLNASSCDPDVIMIKYFVRLTCMDQNHL